MQKCPVELRHCCPNTPIYALEVAISKENYDEVRAISHSLKGSAGSLQLDTVYNLCKDMEALAKNKAHKESNDTYKNLFDSIKNEINI